jgi:nonsense-mediated mRNA decay protein 3
VVAAPESAALLAVCVRRVRGLSRVRLIDAGFIWTEPHSRRLKVKLTVQAEVVGGATLQQGCVVEYVVEPHQCLACTRAATNADAWVASVQVRQHVGHKRTFFYLEQAVLRARADAAAVGVRAVHGGLDFHFASRAGASKFVDFVQSTVPSRHRADKQLVSHNTHTSTYNYKYTFSLEIAPVCRVRGRG